MIGVHYYLLSMSMLIILPLLLVVHRARCYPAPPRALAMVPPHRSSSRPSSSARPGGARMPTTSRRSKRHDAILRSSPPPSSIDGDVRHAAGEFVVVVDRVDGDYADYFIERVSSKARALDVKVFRGFASSSALEYISEQRHTGKNDGDDASSETQEAVEYLMRDHDENGNYVMPRVGRITRRIDHDDGGGGGVGGGGGGTEYIPETFFVAIYNGTTTDEPGGGGADSFARQNGIVGVVSAQPRAPSSLPVAAVAVDDVKDGGGGGGGGGGGIPSPHVYVANLKVDERMRRRGVAAALMSSVISWNEMRDDKSHDDDDDDGTTTMTTTVMTTTPLVLSVDNDNAGAIRLYERFGFGYLQRNDDYCVMILSS